MAEWISVKDKLPTEGGEYLVFLKDIEPPTGEPIYDGIPPYDVVTVAMYSEDAKVFKWGDEWVFNMLLEHPCSFTMEMTHWMPLPQPPMEENCDTCRFNPPSSCDGKPCTQCDTSNPLTNCYQKSEE